MEAAVASYSEQLTEGSDAWEYLKRRGLSPKVIAGARLGVVHDPRPEHLRYRGMLAIPYLAGDGHPVQVRFRCMKDHNHRDFGHGKYNTVSGDPARMFGIDSLLEGRRDHRSPLHVTEGELDSLVLRGLGMYAVAMPGATLWKRHHTKMLEGFNRIFIWGDPDEAGAEMVTNIKRHLRQAVSVGLRDGDVNETFLKHGPEGIRRLLHEAEAM